MGREEIICDTDVLIDYLGDKNDRHLSASYHIAEKIGIKNIFISAVTKMEIIAGARNKQVLFKIEKQTHYFNILRINDPISDIAVDLIYQYNLSHGLAISDALIAATAIYTERPLFTYNLKDFKFISGLLLYNDF